MMLDDHMGSLDLIYLLGSILVLVGLLSICWIIADLVTKKAGRSDDMDS